MKGQGVVIFLIIALVMLSMLYTVISSLGDLLNVIGSSVAVYSRLNDIVNSVANDVFGAVIFLPHDTSLTYNKSIPSNIAGETYGVQYEGETVCAKSSKYSACVNLSGLRYETSLSIESYGVGEICINVRR